MRLARLLDNSPTGTPNNFIVVKPRINGPNHWAIGAVVRVTVAGQEMMRPILAGSSFMGQEPAEAHFGIGTALVVDRVVVEWPNGTNSEVTGVLANQVLTLTVTTEPDSDGDGIADPDEVLAGTDPNLADSDGDGVGDGIEIGYVGSPRDSDGDGTIDALDADDDGDGVDTADEDANGNGSPGDDDSDGDGIPNFLDEESDGDGVLDATDNCPATENPGQEDANSDGFGDACQPDDRDHDGWPDSQDNCPDDANLDQADADANGIGDVCDGRSMAREWNEQLLHAIRDDLARPTVHARNLYHVSAAMWDAWAAFDLPVSGLFHQEDYPDFANVAEDRDEAIAFAAYRVMRHRFANSVGADVTIPRIDAKMGELGYDISITTTVGTSPAALGNRVAETIIASAANDGSNEANDYANLFYQPVNPPLVPPLPGNPTIVDPNRWQPLSLEFFIDQSAI